MNFNIINNILIQCYKTDLFIEKFQVENDKAHPDFYQYLPFLLELVNSVFRSHSRASMQLYQLHLAFSGILHY